MKRDELSGVLGNDLTVYLVGRVDRNETIALALSKVGDAGTVTAWWAEKFGVEL